jgi:hypothetical protein
VYQKIALFRKYGISFQPQKERLEGGLGMNVDKDKLNLDANLLRTKAVDSKFIRKLLDYLPSFANMIVLRNKLANITQIIDPIGG